MRTLYPGGSMTPARRAVAMLLAAVSILTTATVGAVAGNGTPIEPATQHTISTTGVRTAPADAVPAIVAPVIVAPVRRSIPRTPPANEPRVTGRATKGVKATGAVRRGAKPESAQTAVTPAAPAPPK